MLHRDQDVHELARNRRMSANMGSCNSKTQTSIKNDWSAGFAADHVWLGLFPANFACFASQSKADPEVISTSFPHGRKSSSSAQAFLFAGYLIVFDCLGLLWCQLIIKFAGPMMKSWPVRPTPCDTHSAPGANVRRNVCHIPRRWQRPNLYKRCHILAPQVAVEEVLLPCKNGFRELNGTGPGLDKPKTANNHFACFGQIWYFFFIFVCMYISLLYLLFLVRVARTPLWTCSRCLWLSMLPFRILGQVLPLPQLPLLPLDFRMARALEVHLLQGFFLWWLYWGHVEMKFDTRLSSSTIPYHIEIWGRTGAVRMWKYVLLFGGLWMPWLKISWTPHKISISIRKILKIIY